ncbi:MAG: malto-oligosyltrehalose synthase [Deltaproteobacteria bacterium]|nr:MAG: malto-oligosyltrehalose synthase [Deltaproteobacteria bacterium]
MRIPRATYRIQFNPSFGFQAAKGIVSYLAELGISDLYASPIFKARKGSPHGYDVVDQNQINPDLGTGADFEELAMEMAKHELGWLQDIIPNHMAYSHENTMLMDIFENGQASEYYTFFDMEWEHPYESIRGRLLTPFLGTFYGEALEKGEIQLIYDEGGLRITYYEMSFPLKIESYLNFFTHQLARLKRRLGGDHPDFTKYLGIIYILKNLPSMEEQQERYDQIVFAKRMLWELYSENLRIKGFIDENIAKFNGEQGSPLSYNLLDNLLSEQHFRLSFWKVAAEEINYRRFFNINELISLKIEDDTVFNHTHSLIFKLLKEGRVSGLRIDHIDGLYDPTRYLEVLRKEVGQTYVVAEKILEMGEQLPRVWPIQGTTGYDFLNYVNGIFCKKDNERKFTRIYSRFTNLKMSLEELVYEKKRLILEKHMAGDVVNIANLLKSASSRDRHGGDITLYGLKMAMSEAMARFPIYRTYISEEVFRDEDRLHISAAVDKALQSNPGLMHELQFIKRFLLLDLGDYLSEEEKKQCIHFVMRFQQFTGPLMAKGFEDTTLYIYNRLLSLNEVGGFPQTFGIFLEEFHDFNKNRNHFWPHSLNATATHDTKRGEDVRARLNVLSELPEQWETHIRKWSKINRKKKRTVDGLRAPDKNDEYLIYQTLVSAFPFGDEDYPAFVERIKSYLIKAVREAKVHTAWLKPDHAYEEACVSFVDRLLESSPKNQFLEEFLPFQKKVAGYGIFNSLSQTLLKVTAPGVPDFYQGAELWDLNLVDPDNRRPVDFEKRRVLLRDINDGIQGDILNFIAELFRTKEDGRIKLFLIYMALKARHQHLQVFQEGSYIPLEVAGKFRDHIVAFARNHRKSWAVTVAPRFLVALVGNGEYPLGAEVWHDTHVLLPEGSPTEWHNMLTGEVIGESNAVRIADVLHRFPVALLVAEESA